MERRDRIVLQKVLSEIDIARTMMDGCTLEQFKQNEMLMRAVGMTVINIGELVKNLTEFNLCRTQIQLRLDEPVSYFLTESIGNHHLIIKGDHTEIINEFFKWL